MNTLATSLSNLATQNPTMVLIKSSVLISRILRKPLRGLARSLLFCLGFHWVKIKGTLSSSEEAPILVVGPHSTFIDALVLSAICLPSGVSRKENDSIPLVGGTSKISNNNHLTLTSIFIQ